MTGWKTEDASAPCSVAICDPPCDKGTCTEPDTCLCKTGWKGDLCDEPICNPVCENEAVCSKPDVCDCLVQSLIDFNYGMEILVGAQCQDLWCMYDDADCNPYHEPMESHCQQTNVNYCLKRCSELSNCHHVTYSDSSECCQLYVQNTCENGIYSRTGVKVYHRKESNDCDAIYQYWCSSCVHGACVGANTCHCDPFWMGDSCDTARIPVDGGWSDWINGVCNLATCKKPETRSCDNPEPAYGGETCAGASSRDTELCDEFCVSATCGGNYICGCDSNSIDQTEKDNCDDTITCDKSSNSVVISSPGHPAHYMIRLQCYWLIVAPLGMKNQFDFPIFNVEPQSTTTGNCFDWVTVITDGTKYCGTSSPPDATTDGRTLHIAFMSDYDAVATGFKLNIQAGIPVDGGWSDEWVVGGCNPATCLKQEIKTCTNPEPAFGGEPCAWTASRDTTEICDELCVQASCNNGAYTCGCDSNSDDQTERDSCDDTVTCDKSSNSVVISSPGHPDAYPTNLDCYWLITAPLGRRAQLHFTEFEMKAASPGGCDDQVTLSTHTTNYCGTSGPSDAMTTDRVLRIEMYSYPSGSGGKTGFQVTVNSVIPLG